MFGPAGGFNTRRRNYNSNAETRTTEATKLGLIRRVGCLLLLGNLRVTDAVYFSAGLLLWFTTYSMKPVTASKATYVPVFLSQ